MTKVTSFLEHIGSGWHASKEDPIIPSSQLETDSFTTKKRVTFNEQVHNYFTISLQDISPTEHEASWYTKAEYREINKSSCREIKNLDRGKIFKDKKYCSRGLESHTRMGSLAKRMNYTLSHKVVFDEQARQHREGIREEEYLAYLYHSVCSSSQLWANVVALSDQRGAAEETHHDDRVPRSAQHFPQQRLMPAHSTTSQGKIQAIHPTTTRLRIRNIELARAA